SMIALARRRSDESARLAGQLPEICLRFILPLPLRTWHEANAIDSVAIVEPRNVHAHGSVAEHRGQSDVDERVAVRRTIQYGFINPPLRHRIRCDATRPDPETSDTENNR